MMSLAKIFNFEFNSRLMRFFLSLYYRPGKFYRIPFGHLRGFSIWYDRDINYHAILGLWEKNNFDVLERVFAVLLRESGRATVYDIGANIGLFTLFFCKFGSGVKVVAFEAVADTVAMLRRNLDENSLRDVTVAQKAVSSHDGQVRFYIGHHHKSSLLKEWTSAHGSAEVRELPIPSVTLDSFVKDNQSLQPDLIKIDVEGGGDEVFRGARSVMKSIRPIVMFESHNAIEDNAVMELLQSFNYEAFRINTRTWVLNKQAGFKDPEGVWGNLLLFPAEKQEAFQDSLR